MKCVSHNVTFDFCCQVKFIFSLHYLYFVAKNDFDAWSFQLATDVKRIVAKPVVYLCIFKNSTAALEARTRAFWRKNVGQQREGKNRSTWVCPVFQVVVEGTPLVAQSRRKMKMMAPAQIVVININGDGTLLVAVVYLLSSGGGIHNKELRLKGSWGLHFALHWTQRWR